MLFLPQLPVEKVKLAAAPISVLKDAKNPTEAQGMRNSHIRDAAALITFLAALEAGVSSCIIIWDIEN